MYFCYLILLQIAAFLLTCFLAFQLEGSIIMEILVIPFVIDAVAGIALMTTERKYTPDLQSSLMGESTVVE